MIPATLKGPQFDPPPANWVEKIRRRFYSPDPGSGVECSLQAYLRTISYGKASLAANVFNPVTLEPSFCRSMQVAAIRATPAAYDYAYACVVFTSGKHGCKGWAVRDSPFNPPPHGTNKLRNWCHVAMDRPLGVWAVEILHTMTGFAHPYLVGPGVNYFGTRTWEHPPSFTKLKLGWLDPGYVHTFSKTGTATFTLHALELHQPPPPGHVSAVKIFSTVSQRYFLVEARLQLNPHEKATAGTLAETTTGIGGVVIYEIDEAAGSVQLRTPTPLSLGQTYTNQAERLEVKVTSSVPGGFTVTLHAEASPLSQRYIKQAKRYEIKVASSVRDGFTVTVHAGKHPDCAAIHDMIVEAQAELHELQAGLRKAAGQEKSAIIWLINQWQAKLDKAKQKAVQLGCKE